jgi:hypothetical protein
LARRCFPTIPIFLAFLGFFPFPVSLLFCAAVTRPPLAIPPSFLTASAE